MKTNDRGINIYELTFIILAVVILIVIAYYGLNNNHPPASSFLTVPSSSNQNYLSTNVPNAPEITKAADLQQALEAINNTDVGLNSVDSGVLARDSQDF